MDGNPLILAIETATPCGSVAISQGGVADGTLVAEISARPDLTHSRRLLMQVESVLWQAGMGWKDLDGIAVSLGPGSFTGLRIGMAAARGISMAAELPLLGVPTLDGIALANGQGKDGWLCVALDARKRQVFTAMYRLGCQEMPVRDGDIFAAQPQEFVNSIDHPVTFVGDGALLYRDIFAAVPGSRILAPCFAQPRAFFIALLAAESLQRGELLSHTAPPFYARRSDAETGRS